MPENGRDRNSPSSASSPPPPAPAASTGAGRRWPRRWRCRRPGRWRRSASRRRRPRAGPCGRAGRPRSWGCRRTAARGSARTAGLRILPVVELDGLEQRAAQAHDEAPFDLVLRWSGLTIAPHSNAVTARTTLTAPAGRVDGDLGAGGDVAALLGPAGDAEAVARFGLGLAPAELRRGGLEDGAEPGSSRFRRRNSSGSRPAAWASSSMSDSRAKWLAVEASAR